ncbi:MAG: response regulator transcription factor [Pseudomonadota bacterium]
MRIVIADDHPLFRDGLRQLLSKQFGGANIVDAANFSSAKNALEDDTDLLVIDLTFPEFDPLIDLSQLRSTHPTTPIVVMSMENRIEQINKIMGSGVNGYISKATPPEDIDAALREVMQGDIVVYRGASGRQNPKPPSNDRRLSQLSRRQLDVLEGICDGKTNKEIARDLHLSPNTIRLHVSAILKSLRVTSRTGAAKIAISAGLLNTEKM